MSRVKLIPIAKITTARNDRQRFDPESIRELADSIKEHGLAQPVTVRPKNAGYELVAGERRLRAYKLLERKTVPAIVRSLDDKAASLIMLAENVHRAELDPIEEAQAYRTRMDRFGLSAIEVATWANVSNRRVTDRLGLLSLRDDAQKLVATGHLPVGHAQLMAGLDKNRQGMAMRFINTAGKMPTVEQFRPVVGQLMLAQAQESLIDINAFMVTSAAEVQRAQEPKVMQLSVAKLPGMEVRTGGICFVLRRYQEQLLQAGMTEAALVVGKVTEQLLAAGYCGKGWERAAAKKEAA